MIDVTHVTYEIAHAELSSRWEVSLGGILVDAPTPSTALHVIAQALVLTEAKLTPGRGLDELHHVLDDMAAAGMDPAWIAGALWSEAWLRGATT